MTSDELLVTSQKLTSTESFKPTNEPAPPNFEAVSGFELTTSDCYTVFRSTGRREGGSETLE